jgi:hypothetical protein
MYLHMHIIRNRRLILIFLFFLALFVVAFGLWIHAEIAHADPPPPKCCLHHIPPAGNSTPPDPGTGLYTDTSQGVVFSESPNHDWIYSDPTADTSVYSMFVTSDGSGSSGITSNPRTTEVARSVHIEVLIADTHGQPFSAACSSPSYTGDVATDLACFSAAAETQGYPYVVGSE